MACISTCLNSVFMTHKYIGCKCHDDTDDDDDADDDDDDFSCCLSS